MEPLAVLDELVIERAAFVDLLRGLATDDWRRPTECPAYDVQGVAAHVLGDDLSLLSRQRDAAPPGVLRHVEAGLDFRAALDRFNDDWVDTARFFSPGVLIRLLECTGTWTHDWYAAVDPAQIGEPVGFFASWNGAPYWQIAAREYVERWTHHNQVLRALDRPGIDDPRLVMIAAAAIVRAMAAHFDDLGASDGMRLAVDIEGVGGWTLTRADGWNVSDGGAPDADVTITESSDCVASLLSRGLDADEVRDCLSVTGDRAVGERAVNSIVAMSARVSSV